MKRALIKCGWLVTLDPAIGDVAKWTKVVAGAKIPVPFDIRARVGCD